VEVGNVREEPREKLERIEVVRARSGAFLFVGDDADAAFLGIVVHALERDGCPCGVARELQDAGRVVSFEPHGVMDVKPRVGPREHGRGLLPGEQVGARELTQNGAPKGLGKPLDLVESEMDEGAVVSKDAIGDQEMKVRMPVGQASAFSWPAAPRPMSSTFVRAMCLSVRPSVSIHGKFV